MLIDVGGARLFFDVVGSHLVPEDAEMLARPTLLMLHGGPGYDHSTLRPHFDRFADAFQVVYLDHRGCGRSTGAQDSWHLDQWADDIAVFCQRLGIARPVVFGQSFGGMVAMHYAARHPEGLSKLVLSSTAARFDLDATVAKTRALGGDEAAEIARAFFTTPSVALYETYSQVCLPLYTRPVPAGSSFRNRAIHRPEVAVHFFDIEMKSMDLRPGLAGVTCPTLVLAGGQDPVTPVSCSQEIADALGARARLEVFESCGHGVHRDDPEGSERVMRAFLHGAHYSALR